MNGPNLHPSAIATGVNQQRVAHPVHKGEPWDENRRTLIQDKATGYRRHALAIPAGSQGFAGIDSQTPAQLAGVQTAQFAESCFSPSGDPEAAPSFAFHPFQQQLAMLAHSVAVA